MNPVLDEKRMETEINKEDSVKQQELSRKDGFRKKSKF